MYASRRESLGIEYLLGRIRSVFQLFDSESLSCSENQFWFISETNLLSNSNEILQLPMLSYFGIDIFLPYLATPIRSHPYNSIEFMVCVLQRFKLTF